MAPFNPYLPSRKGTLKSAFREGGQTRLMSRMKTTAQKTEATRVTKKAGDLRNRVSRHFERNNDKWVARELDQLAKMPPEKLKDLTPKGETAKWIDPKQLSQLAESIVFRRHMVRLKQIDDIKDTMLRRISQLPERKRSHHRTRTR